jgi:DNA-directed RNA polymerase subunit RPC12/RpoP
MPIVPHELVNPDCCGCIVAVPTGDQITLRCNECGVIVGTIQAAILSALLGLDAITAECPFCGHSNMLPGFSEMLVYVCSGCDRTVEVPQPAKPPVS